MSESGLGFEGPEMCGRQCWERTTKWLWRMWM